MAHQSPKPTRSLHARAEAAARRGGVPAAGARDGAHSAHKPLFFNSITFSEARVCRTVGGVNTLRETDGKWDNGREHAWTQVHAALRPRGRVHCKAPRI
eukprot:4617655-Prymnesium_polylepis.1